MKSCRNHSIHQLKNLISICESYPEIRLAKGDLARRDFDLKSKIFTSFTHQSAHLDHHGEHLSNQNNSLFHFTVCSKYTSTTVYEYSRAKYHLLVTSLTIPNVQVITNPIRSVVAVSPRFTSTKVSPNKNRRLPT